MLPLFLIIIIYLTAASDGSCDFDKSILNFQDETKNDPNEEISYKEFSIVQNKNSGSIVHSFCSGWSYGTENSAGLTIQSHNRTAKKADNFARISFNSTNLAKSLKIQSSWYENNCKEGCAFKFSFRLYQENETTQIQGNKKSYNESLSPVPAPVTIQMFLMDLSMTSYVIINNTYQIPIGQWQHVTVQFQAEQHWFRMVTKISVKNSKLNSYDIDCMAVLSCEKDCDLKQGVKLEQGLEICQADQESVLKKHKPLNNTSTYRCLNDDRVIPRALFCDGSYDCPNKDDENESTCRDFLLPTLNTKGAYCEFNNSLCHWNNTSTPGSNTVSLQYKDGSNFVQLKKEKDFDDVKLISPVFDAPPQSNWKLDGLNYQSCQFLFRYRQNPALVRLDDKSALNVRLLTVLNNEDSCDHLNWRNKQIIWSSLDNKNPPSNWTRVTVSLSRIERRYCLGLEGSFVKRYIEFDIDKLSLTPGCFPKKSIQEYSTDVVKASKASITPGNLALVIIGVTFLLLCAMLVFYRRVKVRKSHSFRMIPSDLRRMTLYKGLKGHASSFHRNGILAIDKMHILTAAFNLTGSTATLSELKNIARDKLTLCNKLGKGAFGDVFKGELKQEKGEILSVAVKTLRHATNEHTKREFVTEAIIMSTFDHENIVKLIGVVFEKFPYYIVLELLDGGDVKTFLVENSPAYPEGPISLSQVELHKVAVDIVHGCLFMEQNHFVHRDVAARNCLLTTRDSSRVAKIADFGMSRDIYRSDYYRKDGNGLLPVRWMPPEAYNYGLYTSKTDVWSFGVFLWEVFSLGQLPYRGQSNSEVMVAVSTGTRLPRSYHCPEEMYKVMTSCWKHSSDDRPSFENISVLLDELYEEQVRIAPEANGNEYNYYLKVIDET